MDFSGVGNLLYWSHLQILKASQDEAFYTALCHEKHLAELV